VKCRKITVQPQLQQLITLSVVLLLGKYAAHIYLPWENILLILLVTTGVEHLMIYGREREVSFFSFSSLSTAIGVMLMMVTPHLWIIFLVIIFGLLQKHFLRYERRHFFNPSNFALMMGLLFFYHDAHIVLGQLGDSVWLGILVIVLGIAILYRVDRWIIPIGFVLLYLLLQYIFIVRSDPVMIMEEVYYRFYSVSFIVFILFMLTDPKTTPQKHWQQLLFALIIASGAILLDYYNGFRVQHLFMVLFVVSPLVPLFTGCQEVQQKKILIGMGSGLLLLALGAIIYIEIQPPYYFEMDG
jgi:Na+-translocating ferredoxin:NAD+ oxidoreductase RnfD subunit